MVLNNIETLLRKYENKEATPKEEQILKRYFTGNAVALHLEKYKSMFAHALKNEQEQLIKDVPLKTSRGFNYSWILAAVGVIFILGFYFKTFVNNDLGTYEDPQLAFNEFYKSMEMVSLKLSEGVSTVGYLDEIENATRIVFKN